MLSFTIDLALKQIKMIVNKTVFCKNQKQNITTNYFKNFFCLFENKCPIVGHLFV